MQEHEIKLIELDDAAIVAADVIGVVKLKQAATLQTPEIPYIQIALKDSSPLLLSYETDDECNKAFEIVKEAIKTKQW